jgi:type III pantothenate kinase
MLLIDVGNSRIKWAFWQNNRLESHAAFFYQRSNLAAVLENNLNDCSQPKVLICSVASAQVNQLIIAWFAEHWRGEVEIVTVQRQQLGVVNAYNNVKALGADRWMAILAAYKRHKQALCVIDCGTAVTIDVVDIAGQHLGGLIMPGMRMMQQALLVGTQKIDDIQGSATVLANCTEDAVIGGCTHLLVAGLDGLYKKYCKQLGVELFCVVTGGDGEIVAKAMESNCHYEQDLILYGLHLVAQAKI